MEQPKPLLPMPIKAAPYRHQIDAFNFVCGKFGLIPASGMASSGAALLMEMGARVIIVTGCINVLISRVSETFIKNKSCIT